MRPRRTWGAWCWSKRKWDPDERGVHHFLPLQHWLFYFPNRHLFSAPQPLPNQLSAAVLPVPPALPAPPSQLRTVWSLALLTCNGWLDDALCHRSHHGKRGSCEESAVERWWHHRGGRRIRNSGWGSIGEDWRRQQKRRGKKFTDYTQQDARSQDHQVLPQRVCTNLLLGWLSSKEFGVLLMQELTLLQPFPDTTAQTTAGKQHPSMKHPEQSVRSATRPGLEQLATFCLPIYCQPIIHPFFSLQSISFLSFLQPLSSSAPHPTQIWGTWWQMTKPRGHQSFR